ncbi:MAG: N-acetyltransferase [Gammaproteobacteria bacterium]|nr:N-acetyltransferase [Gammaproteobacteria bacterium]
MTSQGSDPRLSLGGHEAEMTYSRASAVLIIGLNILPLCPFAKGQFERHPEWRDVL